MKRLAETYNPLKREAEERVRLAALAAGLRPGSIPPDVVPIFGYLEKDRRRDPDNIDAGARKIILDALSPPHGRRFLHCDGWHCLRGGAYAVDVAGHGGVEVVFVRRAVFFASLEALAQTALARFRIPGTLPDLNALLHAREIGARRAAARAQIKRAHDDELLARAAKWVKGGDQ